MSAEPLWRRALVQAKAKKLEQENRTARSRLALHEMIGRAGYVIDLVRIGTWSRWLQGAAYLWAYERTLGNRDNGRPPWE